MLLVVLRDGSVLGAERVLKVERTGDGCTSVGCVVVGWGAVASTTEAGRETERRAALCGGEVTTLCSTSDCTKRTAGERSPDVESET